MEKIILFQGDSITDCGRNRENNAYRGSGYATMVSAELSLAYPYQYVYLNRGISGNRVVDLLARTRADMINLKPDYLSILIGVNDVWHEYTRQNGVDAEKFEKVYCLMIEELQKALPALKIMILEPFVLPGSATENTEEHPNRWEYFRDEVKLRAEAARRVAQTYGLCFVPLQQVFNIANSDAPQSGYWCIDGVHPTAAGHALIKQEWLKAFKTMQ